MWGVYCPYMETALFIGVLLFLLLLLAKVEKYRSMFKNWMMLDALLDYKKNPYYLQAWETIDEYNARIARWRSKNVALPQSIDDMTREI